MGTGHRLFPLLTRTTTPKWQLTTAHEDERMRERLADQTNMCCFDPLIFNLDNKYVSAYRIFLCHFNFMLLHMRNSLSAARYICTMRGPGHDLLWLACHLPYALYCMIQNGAGLCPVFLRENKRISCTVFILCLPPYFTNTWENATELRLELRKPQTNRNYSKRTPSWAVAGGVPMVYCKPSCGGHSLAGSWPMASGILTTLSPQLGSAFGVRALLAAGYAVLCTGEPP